MEPIYLILSFTVFFIYTFIKVVKRDVFFGTAYFMLYIYTIFTQIGYAYFPELSMLIKAYFGPEILYDYIIFVFLSFGVFYVLFRFFHNSIIRTDLYEVDQTKPILQGVVFYELVFIHLLFMVVYFIYNYDIVNYWDASDEDFINNQDVYYLLFTLGFKLSVIINLILYLLWRLRAEFQRCIDGNIIIALSILEIVLLVVVSIKIGSRTDLLALALGIIIFELKYNSIDIIRNKWKLVRIAFFVIVVLFVLVRIENVRSGDHAQEQVLYEQLLFQDYYAPSHILIAAMEFEYINLKEVLMSNYSNSLIKMNYPYLQTTVADLFNPGSSTRSASYAFYIFSEGFIAFGWFGFIYNAIVVLIGLSIWRKLASSNNYLYNLFMLAIISTQLANIARSQSSYFIKDVYMIYLPAMILLYLATGLRPNVIKVILSDKSLTHHY